MVERTKAEGIDEFDGTVRLVELVPDQLNPDRQQWHIEIEPEDKELLKESKTKAFHEWLRITETATENSVAEGSKTDNYIKEIEAVMPATKKLSKVEQVFRAMEGKKFHFVKKILGKSFGGHPAKPSFVPQRLL